MPAQVANAMPSYSKLTNATHLASPHAVTFKFHVVVISGSKQSSAHRHHVKNATDRLKIGRQMEARGKRAKAAEAYQLCRRLKTY